MGGTHDPSSAVPDYFVYVLRNGAGVTYTGIAKDVEARLAKHNANKGARFTRGRGPWTVAHVEGPFSRGDALRRERCLKSDRRFKAALKAQFTGE
jgi:putative endonuclease